MNMSVLSDFVANYNKDKKLYIVAAGCGWNLAQLISIPGASKVIDSIRLLYSKQSWLSLTHGLYPIDDEFKYVSKKGLDYIVQTFDTRLDTINIAITASLPSNYEKRSKNQVFLNINGKTDHIIFPNGFDRNQCDEYIMERIIYTLPYN